MAKENGIYVEVGVETTKAKKEIEEFKNDLTETGEVIEESVGDVDLSDSLDTEEVNKSLDETGNKLKSFGDRLKSTFSGFKESFKEGFSEAVNQKAGDAFKSMGASSETASKGVKALSGASKGLSVALGTTVAIVGAVVVLLKVLFDIIKKLVKAWLNMASAMMKANLTALKATIEGLVGATVRLSSAFLKVAQSAVKSFGSLTGLSSMFSSVTSSVAENLTILARYDSQFNSVMTSLKTSLAGLGGAIASAVAPLLQTLAPALTYIVNLLTRATNAVAQFISALTGKSVWKKAVVGTQNYAKATNNTSKANDKAKKSTDKNTKALADQADQAKETEKQLTGLDELNLWQEQKDTSAGIGDLGDLGDIDDGLDDIADGFGGLGDALSYVSEEIDSKLKDIADKIREFIKNGQWEELGTYINHLLGDFLKEFADKWQWSNIKDKVEYWCNAITETLNAFIADPYFWHQLGRAVGTLINDFIQTIYLLIDNINFKGLGASLRETFTAMIKEIANYDGFTKLGAIIADWLLIIPKVITGFFESLSQGEMGDIGRAIGDFINAFSRKINEFFANSDLVLIGQNIGTMISNSIRRIDWAEIGESLMNLVLMIPSMIVGFIQTLDVQEVAQSVAEFMTSALNTFTEWMGEIDWGELTRKFVDFFTELKSDPELISAIHEAGKAILDGLAQVWDELKPSVTTKLGEIFTHILEGAVHSLVTTNPVTLAFDSICNGIKRILSLFGIDVGTEFDNIKNNILNKSEEAHQGAGKSFEDLSTEGQQAFTDLNTNGSAEMQNFETSATNSAESAKQGILSKFNSTSSESISIFNSMANTISRIISGITGAINSVKTAISNIQMPSFSFSGGFSTLKMPALATGAVIPPNAPFVATLGDQRSGNNFEAPEGLLRQVVREESGNGGNGSYTFIAQLDGNTIFREVIEQAKLRQMSSGVNAFEL